VAAGKRLVQYLGFVLLIAITDIVAWRLAFAVGRIWLWLPIQLAELVMVRVLSDVVKRARKRRV
jgi:uncharacterized membrane protein (DUF485 family)